MAVFLLRAVAHAEEQPPAAGAASTAAPAPPACVEFIELLDARLPRMTAAYDVAALVHFARTEHLSVEDVIWKMGAGLGGADCRAAIAQDRALDFLRAMNSSLQGAGDQMIGHAVLCALHPPAGWAIDWMKTTGCIAGLAEIDEQPEARRAVDAAVAGVLHVGPPVEHAFEREWVVRLPTGAKQSPRLRQRLAPRLAEAHKHQAFGYDAFWNLECNDKLGPPAVDPMTCAELPPGERAWAARKARIRRTLKVGATLLPAVGVVAVAVAERNNEIGRGAAAFSAALGAGLLMGTIVDASRGHQPDLYGFDTMVRNTLGIVLGVGAAAAGGLVAYDSLAGSPGGGIGVAATGMAVFTACMLRFTWDD